MSEGQWRKATTDEHAHGFVAVCVVMEQLRTEKGARVDYLRSYYYTEAMMERYAKRKENYEKMQAVA